MWNKPTKKMLQRIPKIGSQDGMRNPKVYLKFFIADWTWYVTEFDGQDMFYGVVYSPMSPNGERGYFSYSELKNLRKGFMEVDRDIYSVSPYEPKPLYDMVRRDKMAGAI